MNRSESWKVLVGPESESARITSNAAIRNLFRESADVDLSSFSETAEIRHYGPGSVLCSEGETATEVYVLCKGTCGIYTQEADGRLNLIESVSEPGSMMGEQFFRQDRKFRSASILTLGDCEIAAYSGSRFRELLLRDTQADETLKLWAARFARNKLQVLAQEIEELTSLQAHDTSKTRQYPPGTTLYSAGESAENAYFLLSGSVSLFRPGANFSHETIRAGLMVGSTDVMARRPRTETAISASNIEVMEFDQKILANFAEQRGAAGTTLIGLESAHELPQFGTVYRSVGRVEGEPCMISDYRLLNGARVRVRLFPRKSSLEVAKLVAMSNASTLVSPDGKTLLLISPSDELVGLKSSTDWKDMSTAMSLILRTGKLAELQRKAFLATGELLLEAASQRTPTSAEIVCACTNATCATISVAAKRANTVEDLTRITGAGGVCGGCKGRLAMFLGKQDVILCRLLKAPLAEGSFRAILENISPAELPKAKVGQFIRIEALIDGGWMGRPYTLTDSSDRHYELGVKIEEAGFFSNWLRQAPEGTLIRVFAPEGDVCPHPIRDIPLVYVVAGIGVTPAIAAARKIAESRPTTIIYCFRDEEDAPYLSELRELAQVGKIQLIEQASQRSQRLTMDRLRQHIQSFGNCEVIVCGPGEFNKECTACLEKLPGVEVHADSFIHSRRGEGSGLLPGAWRQKEVPNKCPVGEHVLLKTDLSPVEQAVQFLKEFDKESPGRCNLEERIEAAREEMATKGVWHKTAEELGFAAKLAWRNAVRCVGRLYWKGLHLRDCRDLTDPDEMAQALFEHIRFAWNGGDLRPAITAFDPGDRNRRGPRIWNPQLLRYAGVRLRSGKQIGDPAQNALTLKIKELGWEPQGTDFDLLPLVIDTVEHGPRLYELPEDCRWEIQMAHPHHPWLEHRKLKWYAIPAVSDMCLDAGGMIYRMIPFNGWYLNTEIAARNFTDSNRYNLLPELAESMGLDISNDRTLWRDKAMLMLHEAVLYSYDRAGVKMADHHNVCHEFLEFCRNEQAAGREPYGKWMWLVPPFSSSATPLYQEPFRDISIKPAYRYQKTIW